MFSCRRLQTLEERVFFLSLTDITRFLRCNSERERGAGRAAVAGIKANNRLSRMHRTVSCTSQHGLIATCRRAYWRLARPIHRSRDAHEARLLTLAGVVRPSSRSFEEYVLSGAADISSRASVTYASPVEELSRTCAAACLVAFATGALSRPMSFKCHEGSASADSCRLLSLPSPLRGRIW
jgi:hypothetical protein